MAPQALLLSPPDGATDLPRNVEIMVAAPPSVEVDPEVTVDGADVPGRWVTLLDRDVFEPGAPLAPGAVVTVKVDADGETAVSSFTVGDRSVEPPPREVVPSLEPLRVSLLATEGRDPRWEISVEAEQLEAEPYGYFHVVYREASEELDVVRSVWLAAEGPTVGAWTDHAPPGLYCAGIGFVDAAGHSTDPAESCAELPIVEDERGCSTGGAGAPWWVAVLAYVRPSSKRRAPSSSGNRNA